MPYAVTDKSRNRWIYLALIVLVGALVRFWPSALPYCELDGAIYTRTCQDIQRAWASGVLWQQPFTGEYYSSVDYWPPLFPLLSALLGGTYCCAALAGTLTIVSGYFLARDLFKESSWRSGFNIRRMSWLRSIPSGEEGDWAERSALVVAGILALHPFFAWIARTPRSETLYILLISIAMWGLLPQSDSRWRRIVGGLALAGAYMTRLDALLMAAALAVATVWVRGWRPLLWGTLGVAVGSMPQLLYLAWLNGGMPTLVAPNKQIYDFLEGVYMRVYNWPQFKFVCSFGVPGLIARDCQDEAARLLTQKVSFLLSDGWHRLLPNLVLGWPVWIWLAWPLYLALMFIRDRRAQALALCCLPVVGMAIFMSWDVAPRYYAFTLIPLSILAAKGLEILERWPQPTAQLRWVGIVVLVPLWLMSAWIVPALLHPDLHAPVNWSVIALCPGSDQLKLLIVSAGVGVASIVAWRFPGIIAGIMASVTVGGLFGGYVWAALEGADSILTLLVPLALLMLILAPIGFYGTLPTVSWGPKAARWLVLGWIVAAGGSLLIFEGWSIGYGCDTYSSDCWAYLRELTEQQQQWPTAPVGASPAIGQRGPRILSYYEVDILRSGARWLPWMSNDKISQILTTNRPDFILTAIPEPEMPVAQQTESVRQLLQTGLLEPVAIFPRPGNGCVQYQWRIYRFCDSKK